MHWYSATTHGGHSLRNMLSAEVGSGTHRVSGPGDGIGIFTLHQSRGGVGGIGHRGMNAVK